MKKFALMQDTFEIVEKKARAFSADEIFGAGILDASSSDPATVSLFDTLEEARAKLAEFVPVTRKRGSFITGEAQWIEEVEVDEDGDVDEFVSTWGFNVDPLEIEEEEE